jgi:hypothetical protein
MIRVLGASFPSSSVGRRTARSRTALDGRSVGASRQDAEGTFGL